MSRRTAVIEEEFDDDTDLPLPPLPNVGPRGPLLQGLDDEDDRDVDSESDHERGGSASAPRQPFSPSASAPSSKDRVTDITPYKTWTCIYPIYLDAKRPYGTGERRIARPKSLWWPLSKDIAEAALRLGLGTLHEVNKSHPRDWENPGRVRVQWKKNGKLVNPMVKTKKLLLEMISFQIQHHKPENIPRAPYTFSSSTPLLSTLSTLPITAAPGPTQSATSKGKQPLTPKSSNTAHAPPSSVSSNPKSRHHQPAAQADKTKQKPARRQVPVPPEPLPPLTSRISNYSPALATGVLIETVKAGMNAPEAAGLPGAGAGPMGNMAKGKRKVVRVRG